jgi:hypothetical protein
MEVQAMRNNKKIFQSKEHKMEEAGSGEIRCMRAGKKGSGWERAPIIDDYNSLVFLIMEPRATFTCAYLYAASTCDRRFRFV